METVFPAGGWLLPPLSVDGMAEIETGRKRLDVARMYLLRAQAVREIALGEEDPRTQEIKQKLAENSHLQELPQYE